MIMAAELSLSIENDSIKPSMEMGAFEALWANGEISSFRQLRNKLTSSHTEFLSDLVDPLIAKQFYDKTVKCLYEAGIHHFGIRIAGTIDYPETLRDAEYPLALLYYMGNWDLVFSRGVSVIGTRNASPDGIKRTRRLVKGLVDAGVTIFSGLAAGIDTAAHLAAIEAGGSTVAVIGTPLWLRYPKENAELYEKIAKDHLLISQVPIFSYEQKDIKFNRAFFPERNKTMSALSEATVIVEAGETSGTLIQARAALKQGRKVFILNNNFENPRLAWPHRFQKAGAVRVYDIEDILQGLSSGKV
jgi:DNA processing protein